MNEIITKDKELNNCTFVKMVLMILVVAGHCTELWTGSWYGITPVFTNKLFGAFTLWLNNIHTYCFVLVSGYLFYYVKYERGGYQRYLPFIKNKIDRLMVPYIFVGFIWVMPVAAILYEYSFCDIFENFILGIKPGQLWFLLALFNIFVIFFPISDFCKTHFRASAIGMLTLYVISELFAGELLYFQIYRVLRYILIFWIGFILREYKHDYLYKFPVWLYLIIDIGIFVLSRIVSFEAPLIGELASFAFSLVLRVLGALMAFLVLQKVADRISNGRLVVCLEKNSMIIFLFHMQIVLIINSLLNGVLPTVLHVSLSFVLSMTIPLCIGKVLRKSAMCRKMVGEK